MARFRSKKPMLWVGVLGLSLCAPVWALEDPVAGLLGNFGHEFTEPAGSVVWTITPREKGYELYSHGDQSRAMMHRWKPAEIRSFWQKMLWPQDTMEGVECLGNDEEIYCQVPPVQRARIDWIANSKSDYFFYSEMGGVMEIQRLDAP